MIQLNNVRKQYPGFQLDLNLDIPENTISGLVGVNGSGKTTAFKILTGLIQADQREAALFGENAWSLSPALKQKLGAVFSDSGFADCLTLKETGQILRSFYPDYEPGLFANLCRKMDLPMDKPLSGFSTGMKAKAKIIQAISHQPSVLILDEPTAGLDVIARNEILEMLQDYMTIPGRTILISSHIASDLETLCDDFYLIENGSIRLHETVDSLLSSYGVLQMDDEQRDHLDRAAVVSEKQTPAGWKVLVSDRQYYQENYPDLVLDKSGIDDLLLIMEDR